MDPDEVLDDVYGHYGGGGWPEGKRMSEQRLAEQELKNHPFNWLKSMFW
jgi:hypothetical protein